MLKKVKIGKIIGYYMIKLPIDVLILGLLSLNRKCFTVASHCT